MSTSLSEVVNLFGKTGGRVFLLRRVVAAGPSYDLTSAALVGVTDVGMDQAELIRQWSPWTEPTGPQCAEGKYKASRNAY